jgi:hypothetical protein
VREAPEGNSRNSERGGERRPIGGGRWGLGRERDKKYVWALFIGMKEKYKG